MTFRSTLLLGAALAFPFTPALAQDAATPAPQPAAPAASAAAAQPVEDTGDEEEVVIVAGKPRGSVIGDIPPESTLDARDVRATGATNIKIGRAHV